MKKGSFSLIFTIAIIAWGLAMRKKMKYVSGMTDAAPTLENLKRGIANGWYTAELTVVNGQQAVRLSGKLTNGKQYSDVYPVTPEVAQELRKMGVK
jgi:hypothetical protein